MRIRSGTSGYAYPQWRGSFYPADLSNDAMLGHYAQQLAAVEINNTFYRMPKPAVVANWVAQAPAPFEFVVKASQRITHRAKLVGDDATASLRYFFTVLTDGGMMTQLAAVLLQTPPYLRATDATLAAIDTLCGLVPPGTRLAFELAHPSWQSVEVAALLARHGATAVIADRDDGSINLSLPLHVVPAPWAYVRLRRDNYTVPELAAWVQRLRDRDHQDAWVFFKHEDTARGAHMAVEFQQLVHATH